MNYPQYRIVIATLILLTSFTILAQQPSPPIVDDLDICLGNSAVIEATSTFSTVSPPVFQWYDSEDGGNFLFRGNPYAFDPVIQTTIYVQQQTQSVLLWTFDTDLDGWSTSAECTESQTWIHADDSGEGAAYARQELSGESSMFLTSPSIDVSASTEVTLDFRHRYNTETCCDHGYVILRRDGGPWQYLPLADYNIYDFMYNDPILDTCAFSPDTMMYAGDSGGYIESGQVIDVSETNSLEVGFFFSSDASFVDDGWYLDEVSVSGISDPVAGSERAKSIISFPSLSKPSTVGSSICPPEPGELIATSNSNTVAPVFEWYPTPSSNTLLYTGASYIPNPPPLTTTSYYVQEVHSGARVWEFENDAEGWTTFAHCGLTGAWTYNSDNDAGTMYARQIGSGNSSMSLISPVVDVSGDQNDVTFLFDHRYNTESCCDHGYVLYRLDGGAWEYFEPTISPYVITDFMYNDVYLGACAFSPDTMLYAGDSDGYIQSGGSIDVANSSTLQIAFFYSTDASFVDDGWYIDRVQITDLTSSCASIRAEAQITVGGTVATPTVTDVEICPNLETDLLAISNSTIPPSDKTFNWYDASVGGNLLSQTNPFTVSPAITTTYYVEESSSGNLVYDFNDGLNGWTSISECGLPGAWESVVDSGRNVLKAIQVGSGNSSLQLQSPVIPLDGQTVISYNFNHRFNTEACCDHGYLYARRDGGIWFRLTPAINSYNNFDFMYNDPILGSCGFSPDIDLYAGDSGGYLLSAGSVFVSGSETIEFGFLYSSDASFVDDGWYLDDFTINSIYDGCVSSRVPVKVTVDALDAPEVTSANTCIGGSGVMTATSTNNVAGTSFEWFDQPAGGDVLYRGNPFLTPPVNIPTKFYCQEVVLDSLFKMDKFEGSVDPSLWFLVQAGSPDTTCGSIDGEALRFNELGNRLATLLSFDVTNGGVIKFALKISQEITAGCEAAEPGEDVVIEYSTGGAFNIIQTFDQDGYADFTNIEIEIPEAAASPNTVFRLRQLSNSGAGFDVWAIDNFSIEALSSNTCTSPRTTSIVSTDPLEPPEAGGDTSVCPGERATLIAESNSGFPNPDFEWYSQAVGGLFYKRGKTFQPTPVVPTTYYVQERNRGDRYWSFVEDLEGWTASGECGLPLTWIWEEGSAKARNANSGNSSMLLTSPKVSVAGANSVNFSFSHLYNTETCCDHGYIVYRLDGGDWNFFNPVTNPYPVFDFMYNDPILGACGFSPDTSVYAGDSGGNIASSGPIEVSGASELEVAFLFTSDASFVDDGWYINSVSITGLGAGCVSSRTPVEVTVESPPAPATMDVSTCLGGFAELIATKNSTNFEPEFHWFDEEFGGDVLTENDTFLTPQIFVDVDSFWVQEIVKGDSLELDDNFDSGFDFGIWSNITGESFDGICGSVSGSALRFADAGDRFARTQPLNVSNGTIKFYLKISQDTVPGCENADFGEGVVLEYSLTGINGPWILMSNYDPDGYPSFTQVEETIPPGAFFESTIFRIRQLSNSGVNFDNWAIDNFELRSRANIICNSERTLAQVFGIPTAPPIVQAEIMALPLEVIQIQAFPSTELTNPDFEWFSDSLSNSPIFIGNPFAHTYVSDTCFFVRERDYYQYNWTFDTDLEGWSATAECGLSENWAHTPDGGAGAIQAINPSGNSSMLLASPLMNVDGVDEVQLTFDHRYNSETCCDHGYVVYRLDGGGWQYFEPTTNTYNIFDFMYNDPIFGACGFSPDTSVFAGNSGGYLTSSGSIAVLQSSTVEVAFLFTSDASFASPEGWLINEVNVAMTGSGCISELAKVNITRCGPMVTSAEDSGTGTLRKAIDCAVNGDTITFDPSLSGDTIFLQSTINVNKKLVIQCDQPGDIVISGEQTGRTLWFRFGSIITLDGIHVVSGSTGLAAAILSDGHLNLINVILEKHPNPPDNQNPLYNRGSINVIEESVIRDD